MRKPTLVKARGKWRARLWNDEKKQYYTVALNIPVEGKKERRAEAQAAANKVYEEMLKNNNPAVSGGDIADMPLYDYAFSFWQPGSDYIKERALVEKNPHSSHYLLTNRRLIERTVKGFPGFQDKTAASLTKLLIRQWKIWLAEKGWSGRMINEAMQALRIPVKQAYLNDIIPSDPFHGVPRAYHKEEQRGVLIPEEIRRLVETPVNEPRTRLAVYLPLFCSMRMGEVRGLKWGDIKNGVIHIRNNYQEKEGLKNCKCGSEGFVPMIGIVADLLNSVYNASLLNGPDDYVMGIRPYCPVCREYLTAAYKTELLSIGISEDTRKQRNIVYHSLRHSFVTACSVAGLSKFEVMALARHKDEKMFEKYSHGKQEGVLDYSNIKNKLANMLDNQSTCASLVPSQFPLSMPLKGSLLS